MRISDWSSDVCSSDLLGDDKANAARRAGDDRDLAGYALHRAARQLGVEIEIQLPELPELAAIVTDVGALDTGALQRLAGFLVIEHGAIDDITEHRHRNADGIRQALLDHRWNRAGDPLTEHLDLRRNRRTEEPTSAL